MLDLTLTKDLTELVTKSFSFNDIELLGKYIFKKYSTHKLEKMEEYMSISVSTAARRLITECEDKNKLDDLIVFILEADGTSLNGKTVTVQGLENFLYRLSRTGRFFDFNKRKIVSYDRDKTLLPNWGTLREGKLYPIVIASVDICKNSELVKKYKPSVMEKVYFRFSNHLKQKLEIYNGRVWSWAGDGGLIAFRNEKGPERAVACCLEVLLTMPIFNRSSQVPIEEHIDLRIGMDMGDVKFSNDTGRIVSDVINFAAHLEKSGTEVNGISISEKIYEKLSKALKDAFISTREFEGRETHGMRSSDVFSIQS